MAWQAWLECGLNGDLINMNHIGEIEVKHVTETEGYLDVGVEYTKEPADYHIQLEMTYNVERHRLKYVSVFIGTKDECDAVKAIISKQIAMGKNLVELSTS